MNNMLKYIDKYGNVSIDEKPVTKIDILIFSQIPYLNLKNVIPKNTGLRLSDAWELAKSKNSMVRSPAHRNAINLFKKMCKSKRYSDLILKDHEYILNTETQFGVISIIVPNDAIYIAFEGTDDAIAGWKEDLKMTYTYPIPAQKYAYKYLNRVVKFNGPKVVLCGHSKGGNLALVGAMNTYFMKRHKIKKIYSFDGPGIKKKEFKSFNYRTVKKKLVNIIPNQSIIGVLLEQENVHVIKSHGHGVFQHDPMMWVVQDDDLVASKQDRISVQLDESINRWLLTHTYEERKKFTEGIFGLFETAGIESTYDIAKNKIDSLKILVKASKEMDKETKDMIIKSIKLLIVDFGTEYIDDSKKNVINKINSIKKKFKL